MPGDVIEQYKLVVSLFFVASVLLFISFYVLFADTLEEIQNVALGKGERAKVVQN